MVTAGGGSQEDEESFLDESLPQTVPEIQKELQSVGKEAKAVRESMQRPDWNASSPEGVSITTRQEELIDMRERLQQQLLHAKAGRKIVNRLQATGHARQLVPDEEHIMSAPLLLPSATSTSLWRRINAYGCTLAAVGAPRRPAEAEAESLCCCCADRTVAENFAQCESNAQSRSHSKRRGVMAKLKREDGGAPQFSRQARRSIPGPVLQHVKMINWMDFELHELATSISSGTIANEREKGMKVCHCPSCHGAIAWPGYVIPVATWAWYLPPPAAYDVPVCVRVSLGSTPRVFVCGEW